MANAQHARGIFMLGVSPLLYCDVGPFAYMQFVVEAREATLWLFSRSLCIHSDIFDWMNDP